MLRPSPRAVLRPQQHLSSATRYHLARHTPSTTLSLPVRRNISLAPPSQKPRSLKNYAARCAIAAGALWWYMNTDVFAEEGGAYASNKKKNVLDTTEENEQSPTVEEVYETRRKRRAAAAAAAEAQAASSEAGMTAENTTATNAVGDLEEEAESQGAFNEETGEINWDCPCLGGMAHGPCGPEFREAFSCFVYSKEEPKGVDCIDRFKNMQDCFRQHPDIYGAELTDDVDEEGEDGPLVPEGSGELPSPAPASTGSEEQPIVTSSPPSLSHPTPVATREKPEEAKSKQARKKFKKSTEEKVREETGSQVAPAEPVRGQ